MSENRLGVIKHAFEFLDE